MIETPTAIFDVRALAAHPRVSVLVIGTNDLARELRAPLGVPGGRTSRRTWRRRCSPPARPARLILDGVFNDVGDAEGFAAECRQGVEMGFDGKTLIHPSQVEPANAAWTPAADEVEQARRVIEAFAAAEAEGRGVVTVDGRMVEALHVDNARRTLALADAIAAVRDPSVSADMSVRTLDAGNTRTGCDRRHAVPRLHRRHRAPTLWKRSMAYLRGHVT